MLTITRAISDPFLTPACLQRSNKARGRLVYTRDLETICAHWREDSQTKDDTYYVRDYLVYFAPNKTELRTPETITEILLLSF